MSAEELKAQIDDAVEKAIGGDVDLNEIDDALLEARKRVEMVQLYRQREAEAGLDE